MFSDRVRVCPICGGRGEYREACDYLGEEEAWILRKCEDCRGRGWIYIGGEDSEVCS